MRPRHQCGEEFERRSQSLVGYSTCEYIYHGDSLHPSIKLVYHHHSLSLSSVLGFHSLQLVNTKHLLFPTLHSYAFLFRHCSATCRCGHRCSSCCSQNHIYHLCYQDRHTNGKDTDNCHCHGQEDCHSHFHWSVSSSHCIGCRKNANDV